MLPAVHRLDTVRTHSLAIRWNATPRDEQLVQLRLPPFGTDISAQSAKDLAVALARRGLGRVSPNPLVGSVIVDAHHRFLAAGAHEHLGGRHAEINAIEAYEALHGRDNLRDATIYVTLEPCAHTGRTPACAPRLATCGFREVIFGVVDPNPQVSGRGAAILAQTGTRSLQDPSWQPACEELAEVFLWNMRHKKPFVGLKAATTLDGMLARQGDKRAWITGPRARQYGHHLRVYYDAIMVGRSTVELDNPSLDARDALLPPYQTTPWRIPWRVVLDPEAKSFKTRRPCDTKLLAHKPERVVWVAAEGTWSKPVLRQTVDELDSLGVCRLELPLDAQGQFTPSSVLTALYELGIMSVLLEGGAGLYQTFLRDHLVNRLHLFQAPKLFGAENSHQFVTGTPALSFEATSDVDITPLENDWVIEVKL